MPPKPFNKEVLSFHIPLGRHVITPDTCILGAFPLIFHPPPREATLARDREEDCREMDSTKKNIKTRVTACKSMVHTDTGQHLEKSRNPESTGDPPFSIDRHFLDNPLLEARWLVVKRTQPSETWKRYAGEISLSGDRRMETGNPSCHT